LGTLGGNFSIAYSIRGMGAVGAARTAAGEDHAALWLPPISISSFTPQAAIDLLTLGGRHSYAYSINDRNRIVGKSQTASGVYHAVYWQPGEGAAVFEMTDLAPANTRESVARAINNSSNSVQIAGSVQKGSGQWQAFYWARSDDEQQFRETYLGHGSFGPASANSYAYGINELGDIVGFVEDSRGRRHAVLWRLGAPLEPIALSKSQARESEARAVNNMGHVVGAIKAADGFWHAARWMSTNSVPTDLGTLGGDSSEALSINNRDQVVGWSELVTGRAEKTAFYAPATGSMADLDGLLLIQNRGHNMTHALGINDLGEISASGFQDQNPRGFFLEPGEQGGSTVAIGVVSLITNQTTAGSEVPGTVTGMISGPFGTPLRPRPGQARLTAPGAPGPEAVIRVSLQSSNPSIAVVTPTTLDLTGTGPGKVSKPFTVKTRARGEVTIMATDGVRWQSVRLKVL
jgi:probable HAF family extracellular repeat protein